MKTVVTGGAGFIGSHLARALLDQGREVVIADNFSRGTRLNLSDLDIQADCQEIDLRDFDQALKVTRGAETVFHLAARVGSLDWLHGSEMVELEALQTNLLIDTNTFRACIQNRVRKIVYASSVSVYPIHIQNQPNITFSESDLDLNSLTSCTQPTQQTIITSDIGHVTSDIGHRTSDFGHRTINPEGGYGWAKLLGEIQLCWIKDIQVGTARIFNTYGENGALGKSAQVIPALISKAIRYPKEEFIVWGDGKQSRDFLYVSDCVDALLRLEQKISNLNESQSNLYESPLIINVGSDQAIPISSLAERIARLSGKNMEIKYDPGKPAGPISRTADVTKAKALLRWQPKVGLEEGLKRTYAWVIERLEQGT